MTERQHPFLGDLDKRHEYHFFNAADQLEFNQLVAHEIDATFSMTDASVFSNTNGGFGDGLRTRTLDISNIDKVENEEILFVANADRWMHGPSQLEIHTQFRMKTESSTRDAVREMTQLEVVETFANKAGKYLARFTIEQLAGDAFHSTVFRTDMTNEAGHNEGPMVPYDYYELLEKIEVVKALRRGIYAKGRGDAAEVDS